MLETAGGTINVEDEEVCAAKRLAEDRGVNVCHTGSAGFAGLLQHRSRSGDGSGKDSAPLDLIVLSGLDRDSA